MGLKLEAITAPEVLPSILRKVRFGTLDELYASIGYGGTTATKAVARAKDELLRLGRLQAEKAAAAGASLADTAQAALEGAKAGLEATKNMKPKYGKAAVFAAKALGTEDQGATAGMLLVQGLRDGIVK